MEEHMGENKNKKEEQSGKQESYAPKNSVKPIVKSVRTYASDIANLINKGVSLTDIALSEQKRKSAKESGVLVTKKEGHPKFIVSIAVILILFGVAVVIGSFFIRNDMDPQIVELNISPLVFANSQEEISIAGLDRTKILKKINQSRADVESPLGSITNLYITDEEVGIKRLVTAEEFLEKIEVRASEAFRRALGDNFMFGVHSFDGNQAYILFTIDSFNNAFAETLDWEKNMLDDLWVMFYNQKPEVKSALEGLSNGETEGGISGAIFKEGFKDVVVKNKDTRILSNLNNETILIYSFPDRKHMIIATNESTIIEVLGRLTTGRFKN